MKLLLIDGHYYVYRSFFAIPNLSNSRGEPTNAIFGFTKTLRLMMKHLQPELGAVFWDEGLPQRRVELQPSLQGNTQGNADADDSAAGLHPEHDTRCSGSPTFRFLTRKRTI